MKLDPRNQEGRASRFDGRRKDFVEGLANYLLVISGNFLLCFSNSVISTFSKDGHDEVWHTLETRVGKFFCKGPDNKYFRFCRLHSQMQPLNSATVQCKSSYR